MSNPEQAARENLAAQAKKLDELKARDQKLAGEIADALLGGNDVNYLNRENQTIHQEIRQAEDSLRTMKIMLASLAAKHESAERKTEECQKHVSAARTEIVSIQSDRLATALALALSATAASAFGSDGCNEDQYRNVDGDCIPRLGSEPEAYGYKATALCNDGMYSFSQHPDDPNTCSYHGGVDQYLEDDQ